MSPFLVRLADAVGPVVEIVHDVVACVRDVRHGSRDPALHDALLATRAELAGMAQRMDALVAGVERLQAAAGLDRPVVEGALRAVELDLLRETLLDVDRTWAKRPSPRNVLAQREAELTVVMGDAQRLTAFLGSGLAW